MPSFFFKGSGDHRDLHSFPTRRSSDLVFHRSDDRSDGGGGRRHLRHHRADGRDRSEEHTSELQSRLHLVCRLFFLKDPATTEIYTLSLHDALPISYFIEAMTDRMEAEAGAIFDTIEQMGGIDRKSTRLNSSHGYISYAVFFF